ncbi:MAG: DUF3365 domain-containing protein [Pseudomonadota bacterium]|nr:DUF3365 domain-containing protein [Pseudomonadota bacterium]
MKKMTNIALCLTLGATTALAADPQDIEARATEARAAGNQLFLELKKVVTEAAQAQGAAAAIEVCNVKALPTTRRVSEEAGMEVGRTSHKLRNPENAPDAWEQKVLVEFQARKTAGESLENMEYYEVVEEDGKRSYVT